MLTRPAVPAVLLALALAGCARTGEPGAAPVPVASSSSPASSWPASSSPLSSDVVDLPVPGTGKPAAGGSTTITGTVAAGVETGCLILQDTAGAHLLIFEDQAVRSAAKVGTRVTVVGRAEPGMMTTCQQGIPFVVASVRPN